MMILKIVFKLWSGHEIASETIVGKSFRKYESEILILVRDILP